MLKLSLESKILNFLLNENTLTEILITMQQNSFRRFLKCLQNSLNQKFNTKRSTQSPRSTIIFSMVPGDAPLLQCLLKETEYCKAK